MTPGLVSFLHCEERRNVCFHSPRGINTRNESETRVPISPSAAFPNTKRPGKRRPKATMSGPVGSSLPERRERPRPEPKPHIFPTQSCISLATAIPSCFSSLPLIPYTTVVRLDILPACRAYSLSSYVPLSSSLLPASIVLVTVYGFRGLGLQFLSPIVERVPLPEPASLGSGGKNWRKNGRSVGRQAQRMPQLSSTMVQ